MADFVWKYSSRVVEDVGVIIALCTIRQRRCSREGIEAKDIFLPQALAYCRAGFGFKGTLTLALRLHLWIGAGFVCKHVVVDGSEYSREQGFNSTLRLPFRTNPESNDRIYETFLAIPGACLTVYLCPMSSMGISVPFPQRESGIYRCVEVRSIGLPVLRLLKSTTPFTTPSQAAMSQERSGSSVHNMEEKAQVEGVIVDVLSSEVSGVSLASREEERRLVRKLDRRIMPMLALTYFFAALDRTNLGNARLQGLPQDILHGDPTGVLFDWANSAFYFSYVTCQVPALIASKLYPPPIWMGCVVIGWGLSSTLMASAFNFPGLIIARLAMGVFEAGFSPAFPLYLSLFYTREEIGLRMAGWFMFSAVAGAFGGLIAFGVQHAHVALANWRLLFIVEGIPSILLGVLTLVILPDRPEETAILTEREREIALERMNRGGKADVGRMIQRKHIPIAFRDWKIYAAGVLFFAGNCALAGIQGFLPTIIASFGFSDAVAQILTVPPYAVAIVILCFCMSVSDRLQRRGVFLVGSSILAGFGYILLLAFPSHEHVRYFATFCTCAGTFPTIALILTWFSHNLGSETKKAAGMPLYMSIGHCGSILGSHLFPKTDAPHYVKGFAVTCGLQFLSALVTGVLIMYYTVENRRRNERDGKPIPGAPVDMSELADKATGFRYTT